MAKMNDERAGEGKGAWRQCSLHSTQFYAQNIPFISFFQFIKQYIHLLNMLAVSLIDTANYLLVPFAVQPNDDRYGTSSVHDPVPFAVHVGVSMSWASL